MFSKTLFCPLVLVRKCENKFFADSFAEQMTLTLGRNLIEQLSFENKSIFGFSVDAELLGGPQNLDAAILLIYVINRKS
jgi:hypothetical protein